MNWKKIGDSKKGSYFPHDYEAVEKGARFVIINKSFMERRNGWICECNGVEFCRTDTLKAAKIQCENLAATRN